MLEVPLDRPNARPAFVQIFRGRCYDLGDATVRLTSFRSDLVELSLHNDQRDRRCRGACRTGGVS